MPYSVIFDLAAGDHRIAALLYWPPFNRNPRYGASLDPNSDQCGWNGVELAARSGQRLEDFPKQT